MRLSINYEDNILGGGGSRGIVTGTADPVIIPFLDLSRSENVHIATGPNGYESMTGLFKTSRRRGERLFSALRAGAVRCNAGPFEVFKGRLEDLKLTNDSLVYGAYGQFRYLDDQRRTAVYSTEKLTRCFEVTQDHESNYASQQYAIEINDVIRIMPRKGESFDDDTDRGGVAWFIPHRADVKLLEIDFDYDVDLPTNWHARIVSYGDGFTGESGEWNITTSGSGSVTLTLDPAVDGVAFIVQNETGITGTIVSDTGDSYATWSNIRFRGSYANQIHGGQVLTTIIEGGSFSGLSNNAILIDATAEDLKELAWDDTKLSDIFRDVAAAGDDSSPPIHYEVGAWGDFIHFRPVGSGGRTIYIDVIQHDLEKTLSAVANSVYSIYQNPGGMQRRTASATDQDSIDKIGFTRVEVAPGNSADQTEAERIRNLLLSEKATPPERAKIKILRAYTQEGAFLPLWAIRAGDTAKLRNISQTPGTINNGGVSFIIARTVLQFGGQAGMQLDVQPGGLSPTLAMVVAKRAASSLADWRSLAQYRRQLS